MPFYNKYKKELEKAGFTVDDAGNVWDARGNHAACEDRFGNVYANDPNITEICTKAEASLANKTKAAVKKVTAKKKIETLEDGD